MGKRARTDHDRGPVGLEVVGQLPALGGQLLARADVEEPALDLAGLLQHVPDLGGPDPLLGPDEGGLLVAQVHQALLDLGVGGDRGGGVPLVPATARGRLKNVRDLGMRIVPEPGDEGLEGAVGAAPAVVVEAVLHVVVVAVGAVHQAHVGAGVGPDTLVDVGEDAPGRVVREGVPVGPAEDGAVGGEQEEPVDVAPELSCGFKWS